MTARPSVNWSVAVADPSSPSRVIKPNSDGSINGGGSEYETIAASQTDQALGATGAAGDYLQGLLIVPATTGAGSVSIKDGGGSSISLFVSGTLPGLVPFYVVMGAKSTAGAWKVTTGANVSAIAFGDFT